jgi:hypothetical protein
VAEPPGPGGFFPAGPTGPNGEAIADLVEWTRLNWSDLVLKPERGYSGIGVKVGEAGHDADDAIETALATGGYIVQEKSPSACGGSDAGNRPERGGSFSTIARRTFAA